MSEALHILHLNCWLRTGSAGLLRNTGNTPTSNPQSSSELVHIRKYTRHINTPDSWNHHRAANNPDSCASNPHSSGNNPMTAASTPRFPPLSII
jgi:hypothetical protein